MRFAGARPPRDLATLLARGALENGKKKVTRIAPMRKVCQRPVLCLMLHIHLRAVALTQLTFPRVSTRNRAMCEANNSRRAQMSPKWINGNGGTES